MQVDKIYHTMHKKVVLIAKVMNWIAAAALFVMMLLTVSDVFLRKVYSRSIMGTVELSEFLLIILVFCSLAYTELVHGHVKVDLFMSRFNERTQAILTAITQSLCCLLIGGMAWSVLVYGERMRMSGEVSQDLWIPVYPFVLLAPRG